MIVLGINASHNATACLLKDGKILACISEERLTRVKNKRGLPVRAIKEVLKITKTKPREVDKVAFSFKDMAINSGFSVLAKDEELIGSYAWRPVFAKVWYVKEWLLAGFPAVRFFYPKLQQMIYEHFLFPQLKGKLLSAFTKETGIDSDKVVFIDHHKAHAATAYFGAPLYWQKKKLILTLDAMGDGKCATVSLGENGKMELIAQTPAGSSIGDLYSYITRYLGMKMGEHEYKVMGLAPYANEKYVDRVYEKIKDWVWLNEKSLTFGTKVFSHVFYKLLDKPFKNERFDNIAGAIQKITEELITSWVAAAVKKTSVDDVVCAGGVFMNVKANQKIMQLPEVKNLFIFPSCGDESTAIGAAFVAYERGRKRNNKLPRIEPIGNLYLGDNFSNSEIAKEIRKKKYKNFKIKKVKDPEKEVAKLLTQNKIVARFAGRMEWGARALGNRSIITHPQNLEGIREINEQIKNRDFWMPFAPSILSEKMGKYIINPKKVSGFYMILAYDTTDRGKKEIRAAVHQYDLSARPQEVVKDFNPDYHRLISEFEKKSGIGAVLNTSFNLHGYPIVYTPKDALFVFVNSGLEYLMLGSYLVTKN